MSIQAASQTSELLHAALSYAARGWRVLPLHTMRAGRCSCNRAQCPSPAKHPLVFTHDKRKPHYGQLDQDTAFVQVTGGGNCTDSRMVCWAT